MDWMAKRLASCPLACPPIPSATTNKPNCCCCEFWVLAPCIAKRLSSFGLCLRLIPGSERDPTARLKLRPCSCCTEYGTVFSASACQFLDLYGDLYIVVWSLIDEAGISEDRCCA